jgi:hypothetical protein
VKIPDDVAWFVHRLAVSERYRCQPWEIRERWTWRDAVEAHMVLDAFEDAERR